MSFMFPRAPRMQTAPAPPQPEDPAIEDARRRELARQASAGGRRATQLTDYALATTPAPVLRATLGAA